MISHAVRVGVCFTQAKAFDREIGKFYSERSSVCRRNVISFGDSAHEREAILHVTR